MTKLHPEVPTWVVNPPKDAQRRFLFLQGPIGTFFDRLAIHLKKRGHDVHRVHFTGGDRFYCSGQVQFTDFGGSLHEWPEFLAQLLRDTGATDVVLFGDCRPLHRAAMRVAGSVGVPVHVFEEGYLRPNWLTLELGGVNRHSPLARDPQWYLDHAQKLPAWDPGKPVRSSFPRRAAEDVLYRAFELLHSRRYQGYKTHKPWSPLAEYRSGAKRFFLIPWAKRHNARITRETIAAKRKYFLFPLQLEADAQIRFHSPMGSMVPAIRQIIESFARNAPADHQLILTEHPLDTGVIDLRRVALEAAAKAGIKDRLVFLHCGSSKPLIQASRGVVTVNSTMGILALNFGRPVKTIGHAVYDIEGLTFQGKLDQFWTAPSTPDARLFDCFRRVVATASQINGGLFSAAAIEMAVESAAARLTASASQRWLDWGLIEPGSAESLVSLSTPATVSA